MTDLRRLWTPHEEICGFILDDGSPYVIANAADDPSHSFEFDLDSFYNFLGEYGDSRVIGIFHTHPNNNENPSWDDMKNWPTRPGLRYWIVTKTLVLEWKLNDRRTVAARISRGPSLDLTVHPSPAGERQASVSSIAGRPEGSEPKIGESRRRLEDQRLRS